MKTSASHSLEYKRCEQRLNKVFNDLKAKEAEKASRKECIESNRNEAKRLKLFLKESGGMRLRINEELSEIQVQLKKTQDEMNRIKAGLLYKTRREYEDMIKRFEIELQNMCRSYSRLEESRLLNDIKVHKQGVVQLECYEEKKQIYDKLKEAFTSKKTAQDENWKQVNDYKYRLGDINDKSIALNKSVSDLETELDLLNKSKLELKKQIEDLSREQVAKQQQQKRLNQEKAKVNKPLKEDEIILSMEDTLRDFNKLINYFQRLMNHEDSLESSDPGSNSNNNHNNSNNNNNINNQRMATLSAQSAQTSSTSRGQVGSTFTLSSPSSSAVSFKSPTSTQQAAHQQQQQQQNTPASAKRETWLKQQASTSFNVSFELPTFKLVDSQADDFLESSSSSTSSLRPISLDIAQGGSATADVPCSSRAVIDYKTPMCDIISPMAHLNFGSASLLTSPNDAAAATAADFNAVPELSTSGSGGGGSFIMKKKLDDDSVCNKKLRNTRKAKSIKQNRYSHSVEVINLLSKMSIPIELSSKRDECLRQLRLRRDNLVGEIVVYKEVQAAKLQARRLSVVAHESGISGKLRHSTVQRQSSTLGDGSDAQSLLASDVDADAAAALSRAKTNLDNDSHDSQNDAGAAGVVKSDDTASLSHATSNVFSDTNSDISSFLDSNYESDNNSDTRQFRRRSIDKELAAVRKDLTTASNNNNHSSHNRSNNSPITNKMLTLERTIGAQAASAAALQREQGALSPVLTPTPDDQATGIAYSRQTTVTNALSHTNSDDSDVTVNELPMTDGGESSSSSVSQKNSRNNRAHHSVSAGGGSKPTANGIEHHFVKNIQILKGMSQVDSVGGVENTNTSNNNNNGSKQAARLMHNLPPSPTSPQTPKAQQKNPIAVEKTVDATGNTAAAAAAAAVTANSSPEMNDNNNIDDALQQCNKFEQKMFMRQLSDGYCSSYTPLSASSINNEQPSKNPFFTSLTATSTAASPSSTKTTTTTNEETTDDNESNKSETVSTYCN